MKHSLWPSVLSDRATVYTRKLTGDLWLWRKCTKSPGIYQRLSNWTCMFQLIRALHLDSDWYLGKQYMKREANGIYSMIIFQGQDTDFHPEQCQLKKNLFNEFLLLFTEGHRNQRGSAPGHGAPGFTHHGRDFHRAREEVETRRHGRKVGAPGSGSVSSNHFNGAWRSVKCGFLW